METANFKNIMIATDGSTCSKLAADKGIELARLSKGKVYAIYVMSTAYLTPMDRDYYSATGMNPYYEPMYGAMHEAMEKLGQQALDYVKSLGEEKRVNVEDFPTLAENS